MKKINTLFESNWNWKNFTKVSWLLHLFRLVGRVDQVPGLIRIILLTPKSHHFFLCRVTTSIIETISRVIEFTVLCSYRTLRFLILLSSIIRKLNCCLLILGHQEIVPLDNLLTINRSGPDYSLTRRWKFFINHGRFHSFEGRLLQKFSKIRKLF